MCDQMVDQHIDFLTATQRFITYIEHTFSWRSPNEDRLYSSFDS
jgi:hypothetical protein